MGENLTNVTENAKGNAEELVMETEPVVEMEAGQTIPEAEGSDVIQEAISGTIPKPVTNNSILKPMVKEKSKALTTSDYKMVTQQRQKYFEKFELMKTQNPDAARSIEEYVKSFDYVGNPKLIESFAFEVLGKNSVDRTLAQIEQNKDSESYELARDTMVALMKDMEKPKRKPLWIKIMKLIDASKAKAEIIKLENSRIEKIFDGVGKRLEEAYLQVSTENRQQLDALITENQQKSLKTNMYIIAGEFILKDMVEGYLLPAKQKYEADKTNSDNLIEYRVAEQKVTTFVSRLNDVLTMSSMTHTGIEQLLYIRETGKELENYLQRITSTTLPALADQCLFTILRLNNDIPTKEAEKIQQMTADLFEQNAIEAGKDYIESLERANKPIIPLEVLTNVEKIKEETQRRAEEIKGRKLSAQLEMHDKIALINDNSMMSADAAARSTMTPEELEMLQKTADAFNPQINS